jgi:putative CocE/NonD family hydrolase
MTATGVLDQGALEDRTDVLVYTSAHLLEPLEIAGPVGVELFVRTSAPTADFVATLVDVDGRGRAANIVDGAGSIDLAASGATTEKAVSVTIDLHATAYTVPAGHRLRVHVTSSSFPRLQRNPHAGVHHVLHDADHPSSVVLAIL